MVRLLFIFCLAAVPLTAAAEAPFLKPAALQELIDRAAAADPTIPGVQLAVYSPTRNLDWRGASGHLALSGGVKLDPDQPFRLASVTKAFTAAAVLRLVEDKRLVLTDPIEGLVSLETAERLRTGGYDPSKIRLEHLLAHTSGLVDHGASDVFGNKLVADGQHVWTRQEQIALAMVVGKPWAAPGLAFHYSDTGYVILGEILERSTGQPLAEVFRSQLDFKGIGLGSTWFEKAEAPPRGVLSRAHQYIDAGGVDATNFDPSFDLYGGGGLVSTTKDLTRFFRALILGRLFHDPSTLPAGLAAPGVTRGEHDPPYADLLPVVVFGPHYCWGKTGFWGSIGLYCPDIDLAIGLTVNRGPSPTRAKVLADLAVLVDQALVKAP